MRKQQNCRDITPLINHEEKTNDINIVKEGGGGGGMVQHPSYLNISFYLIPTPPLPGNSCICLHCKVPCNFYSTYHMESISY